METKEHNEIVCACVDLAVADLQSLLQAEPDLSFDALLAKTGAGEKCTACLLDLEYYYTALPRNRGHVWGKARGEDRHGKDQSLKQQLYSLMDRLSPATPVPLAEYMPLLCGKGIEEWVCVANHSMLFQGVTCAPDTDVRLVVRNASGREVHRERFTVAAGEARRVLVSSHIETTGPSDIGIGSVQVERRARRPGIRGTIRPQVEIVTAAGSCAVHTQAPGRVRDRWLSVYHRPTEERLFVSAVNASSAQLCAEVQYPYVSVDSRSIAATGHVLEIPPYGAVLHEVVLPESVFPFLRDKLYSLRLSTNGLGKMHVFCSTPSLDRFSIDHL